MKYSTILSLGALLVRSTLAKPIQPEFTHSIPEVLNEGEPIKNWNLQGTTKVFSDRLTLTDLGKPNQRGAAWSTVPNDYEKWTIDVDFSVAGPINPGGGLALWYTTKAGVNGPVHGSNDQWDGLGIFIDSVGEGPDSDVGTIRAYLNDGTFKYASASKPIDNAFAMCQLGYRNTGYNTQLKVSYQDGFFRIKVNGQLCFQTDKVKLFKGGFFGITAKNTENPDSFILHRVQVYSAVVPPIDEDVPNLQEKIQEQADVLLKQQQQKLDDKPQEEKKPQVKAQEKAEEIPKAPLQERSVDNSALNEILSKLNSLSDSQSKNSDAAAQDARSSITQNTEAIKEIKNEILALQKTHIQVQDALEKKLNGLEIVIKDLIEIQRRNIEHGTVLSSSDQSQKARLDSEMKRLHNRLEDINAAVKEHTESLIGSIPGTVSDAISKGGPSIWMVFILFLFIQGGVFVGYLIYKTRRASYHAKML